MLRPVEMTLLPLVMVVLTAQARTQLKTELSPAVSFHCSSMILRVWHFAAGDYARMSDDLENIRADLSGNCLPQAGWTIEDGFYHASALGGIASELLVRSGKSDVEHMEALAQLIHENRTMKIRSSNSGLEISSTDATNCRRAVAEGKEFYMRGEQAFDDRKYRRKALVLSEPERDFLHTWEDVDAKIRKSCFVAGPFVLNDPVQAFMLESHRQLAQERYAYQIEFLLQGTALNITKDMMLK